MLERVITIGLLRTALWLSATLWFALLFTALFFFVSVSYERSEPLYMNPVKTEDGVFRIRNDKMGKGHFGANRGKHNERLHEGLDIAAPFGTDVVASKTGRVTFASSHGGYGRYIRINHPDSSETRYAHLSKIRVIQGDWVKMGKLIGAVGNSGNAADPAIRPHVHFEIRQNGRPMNPLSLMEIRRNDNEA